MWLEAMQSGVNCEIKEADLLCTLFQDRISNIMVIQAKKTTLEISRINSVTLNMAPI